MGQRNGPVRIGIDVGGTFTDVVAIDQTTRELIGQLKVPTSHSAREGVARGIVEALERSLAAFQVRPEQVSFIAHSTTQATNALLEGDVATVGVIGIGQGLEGWLVRRATRIPPIPLTSLHRLTAPHVYLDLASLGSQDRTGAIDQLIEQAIGRLRAAGAEVIVASEAFGVDRTALEERVVERAQAMGLRATSGHEVSSLYGLRVRTRTAVINGAILPRMIETAEMTERCVRETGITAPLMIMRSDGGVMSVAEVHRRPILTMLSGPAAGIAGTLLHERVSDGIFIEVGGTSADISVIRDGSPATRPARLGGHRMYVDTLDVRTLGVGGGSLVRVILDGQRPVALADVGPRSAHIAGYGYVCYTDPARLAGAVLEIAQPTDRDARDHIVFRLPDGQRVALTTTCAANCLGLVSPGQFAYGQRASAQLAFHRLAEAFGSRASGEEVARQVLTIACRKIRETLEHLMVEYRLARDQVVLVGGGGGGAVLVPFTAEMMSLEHRLARNAEVISPIGVAMAMVRDTVERTMVDPTPDDLVRVRREATEAAIAAGAVPGSVEVEVEVDPRRNLVRAIAIGATELRRDASEASRQTTEQCRQVAVRSMRLPETAVHLLAEAGSFLVFGAAAPVPSRFRRWRDRGELFRIVDRTGVVRLQRQGRAVVLRSTPRTVREELTRAVESLTDYGDAGRTLPDLFLLYGTRLANFSGLATLEQVLTLVEVELGGLDPDFPLGLVACAKEL